MELTKLQGESWKKKEEKKRKGEKNRKIDWYAVAINFSVFFYIYPFVNNFFNNVLNLKVVVVKMIMLHRSGSKKKEEK